MGSVERCWVFLFFCQIVLSWASEWVGSSGPWEKMLSGASTREDWRGSLVLHLWVFAQIIFFFFLSNGISAYDIVVDLRDPALFWKPSLFITASNTGSICKGVVRGWIVSLKIHVYLKTSECDYLAIGSLQMCMIRPPKMAVLLLSVHPLFNQCLLHLHPPYMTDLPS